MRRRRSRGGFLMVEAAVTFAVIGYGIVALAPVLLLIVKANLLIEEIQISTHLATSLMEEVQLRRWDETCDRTRPGVPATSYTSTLGAEEAGNAKKKFDDVDDFQGLTESPPRDPMGSSMTEYPNYVRTATVQYVDSSFAVSGSPTNYKLVTVCVAKAGVTRTCLKWVAHNYC